MILYADVITQIFIKYLNNEYAVREPVYITILHGYDSVESDNGNGFAAYLPDKEKPIMMIAGEISEKLKEEGITQDMFLECIAHEYKHHIQFITGKLDYNEKNEKDAERFAKKVVEKFYKEMWLKTAF